MIARPDHTSRHLEDWRRMVEEWRWLLDRILEWEAFYGRPEGFARFDIDAASGRSGPSIQDAIEEILREAGEPLSLRGIIAEGCLRKLLRPDVIPHSVSEALSRGRELGRPWRNIGGRGRGGLWEYSPPEKPVEPDAGERPARRPTPPEVG